jgi:outer membrane protein assembly factor BamB
LSEVALSGEGEWARFRGPNGTGIGKADLPVEWTSKDYRWQTTLPDVGHSSPVVWGHRLFVTSGSEGDATLFVCCLDADSGKILWTTKFAGTTHKKNKLNGYASSTPAVDEDRVYVATGNPERYLVIALAQTDGHELWRRDLGPFEAEHGFGTSPILFEDLVIVANEQNGPSSIVALDRKTGNIRWQAKRRTQRAAYSTPCLYQPKEGPAQLIATSSAHGISSIDPRSGKANWELPLFKSRVVGSPLVAGDLIIASAGSGGQGHQMFAVKPGDPVKHTKPEVAYEVKETLPYVPISVSDGPRVYLFNDQGIVSCLETATGKLCWRERLTAVKFFGSPVLVGDRLYCVSREGTMVVLAAADKYQLLARFELGEPTQTTPAVANNRMYLRLSARLMALSSGE